LLFIRPVAVKFQLRARLAWLAKFQLPENLLPVQKQPEAEPRPEVQVRARLPAAAAE
jgi:hypothetical protein